MDDYGKHVDRVSKLIALAGRSSNEHERKLAAQRAADYLDKYAVPLRWRVPVGTEVRVVPSQYMANGMRGAVSRIRKAPARNEHWLFEAQRVKGEGASEALSLGWLHFKRHGYDLFVPAGSVEVFL